MMGHHCGHGMDCHFLQPSPDSSGFGDSIHNFMVLGYLDDTFIYVFAVPMTN